MRYLIKKVVPVEISEPVTTQEPVEVTVDGVVETLFRPVTTYQAATVNTLEDVGDFVEEPAPGVTLGGHLLALKNETGFDHVAVAIGD